MSAPNLKVLISGAGIAGSCLAYWLSRTRLNTSITIVERSLSPRTTGQSIDMHGPAIEIIKRMNLDAAVRACHTTEEGTQILNSKGKPFAQFETGDAFTAEYEILRGDLSRLFLEATEGLKGVKYMYGDYVSSLEQREKDVQVKFNQGSEETYDLVIGADGSTSRTRDMILDETVRKDCYNLLGQYIAFFTTPSQPTDNKMWKWYGKPGLGMMMRPHRNPATMGVYMTITLPKHGQQDPVVEEAMGKGTEETKRMFRKYFENVGWEAERLLDGMDASDDFYMARAAIVRLPKWTSGRTLVVGDAAFATFGVGTSLAIESSYFLAGELSKIKSSEDIPAAIQKYEDIFRPLYEKMVDVPPWYPQILFPTTALGLWLRNCAIWLASKTKVYKLLPDDEGVKWKLPDYDWKEL
ncbi:FAD/NAD(P)-binding domain-containing protein [Aulographum hederae CBS 113979]|uniref:FAD/NAD(P)-binding domain-containing protein n=1 Tax=Aulographum hederae CBS 113979 TaxID=1176131 RepID=A0A6G1HCF5_9PEZI|nr:FAD/NAD(P)-binding domain-containing protein [Aulographum hederae CBS 113979]